jgi:hypothetical protein
VFRRLCTKVVCKSWEGELMDETVIALCMMEKEFPLGFFNIMTHLMIHLVEELFICGPVQTRWMYPIERYMKYLKDYVRTKARPEGSMAKDFVIYDTLGFCIEYMLRETATRRRVWDEKDKPGLFDEELEGGGVKRIMNENVQKFTHAFVMDNGANAWLGVSLLAPTDLLESKSFFAYKVEFFKFFCINSLLYMKNN